jgi:hypothetical protein
VWSRRSRGRRSGPELDWEQRLETLEARIEHLESAHEGLQDAVYRRAVLEDASIEELRRRSESGQIARDRSENARRPQAASSWSVAGTRFRACRWRVEPLA